jgi:(S)-3,5-dihydroxyphenylglycine transaminase
MVEGPRRVEAAELLRSETYAAMDILNGVAERFPDAISLAAGRPPGAFLPAARTPDLLERAIRAAAEQTNEGLAAAIGQAWIRFGQYADTDGIILDDLRVLLRSLEGLDDPALDLRVTNGIQEALLLECAHASAQGGAVLCFDPVYAGLTGAAAATGLPLYAMPRGGDPAETIAAAVHQARLETAGPLLLYVIPDHDNPTGLSLSLAQRQEIVELARRERLIVLEDTAYRLFNYDQDRLPTLFALAEADIAVIYLSSFSKTMMPGVRIGFAVRRKGSQFNPAYLGDLTNLKSYASVTSAPIAQAIVAGFLQDCGYDLDQANQTKRNHCRANRDALAAALQARLPAELGTFCVPAGGFFLTVDIDIDCGRADMERAARDYSVIFIPMVLFSPTGQGRQQIRLSFSAGSRAEMTAGAERLANFLADRIR